MVDLSRESQHGGASEHLHAEQRAELPLPRLAGELTRPGTVLLGLGRGLRPPPRRSLLSPFAFSV
jgi:hypothetical protein